MDARHLLGASPGSGGSGGRSVGSSARHRRRMSTPTSAGTRLMPRLNAAAGEDGSSGSGSSSPPLGRMDLGPHEPQHRYNRRRVFPEAPLTAKIGRFLFLGSSMGSSATEDEVLVMDGVLVANGSATTPGRSASFTDLGFASAGSPGSGGSGGYGPNHQFVHGRENALRLNPIYFSPSANIPPGARNLPPPPSSAYLTPARATPTRARAPVSPASQAAAQPGAAFAWPPTEEEDASISRSLYGSTPPRRLPVFRSICPE